MSKRSGLFGSRPGLLLVDERPPGINIEAVAADVLPRLEDEPEEAAPVEDPADEDSYDGGGPLRIFIGNRKDEADEPAPPPAVNGPVWDASALVAGDEDADVADDDDEGEEGGAPAQRAPVLLKGRSGPEEPPPLTMSFGGSFVRGSMDAGVMDEEEGGGASTAVRIDTVVVHDQIFDRFLRFDDPLDAPPIRGPVLASEEEDEEEPLSVGGFDDEEALGAAGFAAGIGDLDAAVVDGPPPTRGLRVGFVPGHDDDEYDDDEYEDDEYEDDEYDDDEYDDDEYEDDEHEGDEHEGDDGDDALDSMDRYDGGDLADDEDEPLSPRVIIGDHHTSPPPVVPAARQPAPPLVPDHPVEQDTELDLPQPEPTIDSGSRTAPDWAARRREAQVGARPPAGREEDDDGGGVGLLIFVVLAIAALAVTWYLIRGNQTATTETPDPAPTEQVTPDVLPEGADAVPEDGVQPLVPGAKVDAPPTEDVAGEAGDPDATAAAPDGPSRDEGVLQIRANRPCRVYIDGRYVGQTPLPAVALPGGSHDIRVVAIDSGRTRSQTVRVDAGRSQEVRFPF